MEIKEHVTSELETLGGLSRKLSVTIAPAFVEEEFKRAFSALNRRVKLKGFRKGKVPRTVLEREYGHEVSREVVSELIEKGCAVGIEHHGLDVVVQPRLLTNDLEDDRTLRFQVEVEVRPEFTLAPYSGLEVDRRIVRVGDEQVDRALRTIRERMAVLETDDDKVNVEPGDIVSFDMYGFSEGEAVPGTSGEGIQLEVGQNRFPEDFEKQLVGVTRGIKTPIEVTFPDDHHDEAVAGKRIRFDVTVKEIKHKVLPDLNDDLARELGWEGCETLDALREKVREDLIARSGADADDRLRGTVIDKLVEANSFAVPDGLVENATARIAHELGLHEIPKDKVAELRDALRPRAVRQVKAAFVLDAIAEAEKLEVSKDELEQALRTQMARAGEKADEVRKHYARPGAVMELHGSMLREKALEKTIELSTRRDVEVDESQVADTA